MKQRVFFVFEGGGAKGISHIGALKAIENRGLFSIEGAAGTSAGSIVASLVAVGYKADELFKHEPETGKTASVFDQLGDSFACPMDLIEPRHRWRILAIRRLARRPRWFWGVLIALIALIQFYPALHWGLGPELCWEPLPRSVCEWTGWIMRLLFAGWSFGALLAAYMIVFNFHGLASLNRFSEALNQALSKKVAPRNGRMVTFGDLKRQNMTLKVVASDLTERRLRLFSTESTECHDVPVAHAVAASSALPFVFRPVEIQSRKYCDGGMVSNLPAWTFDDQLVNDDKCWVVTSESKDHEFMGTHSQVPLHGSRRPKGLRLIRDIGYTALFGASDLNTRGLNHHLQFPIPVDIGLLDFDLNDKRCAIEIGKARVTCDGLISARLKEVEFLDDIHEAAVQELQAVFFPDELRLRTALVREMRLTGSEVAGYHLWASRGFDNDADENLKLSRSGTLIEECLSPAGSEGASADLETEEGDHRFYRVGRPGYLKSVTPPDRKWAMAFPLADPTSRQSGLGRVSVAVTFDGDLPITGRVLEIRRKLKELTRRWQTY